MLFTIIDGRFRIAPKPVRLVVNSSRHIPVSVRVDRQIAKKRRFHLSLKESNVICKKATLTKWAMPMVTVRSKYSTSFVYVMKHVFGLTGYLIGLICPKACGSTTFLLTYYSYIRDVGHYTSFRYHSATLTKWYVCQHCNRLNSKHSFIRSNQGFHTQHVHCDAIKVHIYTFAQNSVCCIRQRHNNSSYRSLRSSFSVSNIWTTAFCVSWNATLQTRSFSAHIQMENNWRRCARCYSFVALSRK